MLAGVLAVLAAGAPEAKVHLTLDEALRLAFPPGAVPERRTAFLTDAQARRVEQECGEPPGSKVITYYRSGGTTAYFDTHVVRTLPETIMVVIGPDQAIGRIDILSFGEPEEYLPKERWLDQLEGRKLDDELSLRRGVRPITGATLSGRAIVAAARRVLATHRVLADPAPPAQEPPAADPNRGTP